MNVKSHGKKLIAATLAALLWTLLFSGCAPQTAQNAGGTAATDRAGFEINVPSDIESIVSMAPATTQILVDLGLGDKITAMDTQSAMLEGVDGGVPAFDMLSPDVEKLASLKPDIIFASSMSMMGNEANDPFAPLKKLGICVAYIPTSESVAGIKDDIRFIAAVTGKTENGERLISDMDAGMEQAAAMRDLAAPAQTVYFEISAAPAMYSFGKGVFLNEMLETVGTQNIFSGFDGWLPVEAESVVSSNPDIIFTNVNYIDDPVHEIMSRPGWENISAVKNGRVYYIDNSCTSLPNHNIAKGTLEMAGYVYGNKE